MNASLSRPQGFYHQAPVRRRVRRRCAHPGTCRRTHRGARCFVAWRLTTESSRSSFRCFLFRAARLSRGSASLPVHEDVLERKLSPPALCSRPNLPASWFHSLAGPVTLRHRQGLSQISRFDTKRRKPPGAFQQGAPFHSASRVERLGDDHVSWQSRCDSDQNSTRHMLFPNPRSALGRSAKSACRNRGRRSIAESTRAVNPMCSWRKLE